MNNSISKRMDNLDIIRIFAALSVTLFHYTVQYPLFSGEDYFIDKKYLFLWRYGSHAIELFFILSSFVILISAQKYDSIAFLKKRLKRIYPSLILCCSLSFIVLYFTPYISSNATIENYFYNISLISFFTNKPFIDGAYWTLCYEFGFYIFIACSYKRFFKNSPHILILYCISNAYIFYFFSAYIPSPIHLLILCHKYSHIFAFGIIMYFWYSNSFSKFYILYFMLILGINYLYNGVVDTIILSVLMLITTGLIFYKLPQNYLTNTLASTGQYSYPFYLLHQMIGFVAIYHIRQYSTDPLIIIGLTIILILILSVIVVKIEGKILSFLTRLYPIKI